MAEQTKHWVVYMCSWCGATQTRSVMQGRPCPGTCCRRPRMRNGKFPPHRWTVSRRY